MGTTQDNRQDGRDPVKKSFLLRISPELWDDLNRLAAEELRSVNGQIEYLLRQAVERRKRGAAADRASKDGSAPNAR